MTKPTKPRRSKRRPVGSTASVSQRVFYPGEGVKDIEPSKGALISSKRDIQIMHLPMRLKGRCITPAFSRPRPALNLTPTTKPTGAGLLVGLFNHEGVKMNESIALGILKTFLSPLGFNYHLECYIENGEECSISNTLQFYGGFAYATNKFIALRHPVNTDKITKMGKIMQNLPFWINFDGMVPTVEIQAIPFLPCHTCEGNGIIRACITCLKHYLEKDNFAEKCEECEDHRWVNEKNYIGNNRIICPDCEGRGFSSKPDEDDFIKIGESYYQTRLIAMLENLPDIKDNTTAIQALPINNNRDYMLLFKTGDFQGAVMPLTKSRLKLSAQK